MIQLIYVSKATQEFSFEELAALLEGGRARNKVRGLSGMIVFHEGWFLQMLEGDAGIVDPLFEKISKDERHTHIRLLLRREIDAPRFDSLSFGLCGTNEKERSRYPGLFEFEMVTHPFGEDESDSAHQLFLKFRDGAYHQVV